MQKVFELLIIGAGPAGLAAAIYASFFKLESVVIGREVGGQLQLAPQIFNYPGFPKGVTGKELVERMMEQVEENGGKIIRDIVIKVQSDKGTYRITTEGGKEYRSQAIIVATGAVEERKKSKVAGTSLLKMVGGKLNGQTETEVPGVFVAGDIINYGVGNEQITLSIGQGARAAEGAFKFVRGEKAPTVWGKTLIMIRRR